MAQTSSQRKNILAMGGFLAFIALMTLLLFVANYISQRTEQEDTSAETVTYDKHYLRVFLHESGKRFYTQFCDATSVSPTGEPINFNTCGAMRTHTVKDLKLPAKLNDTISSISFHNGSQGSLKILKIRVTDALDDPTLVENKKYYHAHCVITNGNINDCFNQNISWFEQTSSASEMNPQIFSKIESYEESDYKDSDNRNLYIKSALSVPSGDAQHLYIAICNRDQDGTDLMNSCDAEETIRTSDLNLPAGESAIFRGINYSLENHSGIDKLRESFVLEEGNGYISRLCERTSNEDIHQNCSNWNKVLYSQSIKNLPEYTTRDWTSLIGDLSQVPWENIAKSYIQTFLSTDKTKIYQRFCPINEDLVSDEYFGDSVIYTACTAWTTHEISALNGSGLTINAQKLKSMDFFDYQKANGTEFMRQQLVINDSDNDVDKLYTRDCPIEFKNLNCSNAAWSNTNVNTLQITDANQTLTRIRGLDSTITTHGGQKRLRQVALQEDGKAIFSRACEYNADTLVVSNCEVWNKVIINILDFDNDQDNGIGAIEDVLLATDTYTQMVNGVPNIRQSFLREDGQSLFTRICRLNTSPNGSFDCQANTPEGRLWSEIDLNEFGDGIDLVVNKASGLDGSVSPARNLPLPTILATSTPTPTPTSLPGNAFLQTVLSHDKTKIYERSCPVNAEANGETINYAGCSSWKTNPVTALNTVAKNDKPAVNFGAAGITVKSFNMYRQVLDGGVVSVRQSVHTNEGESDYIYNRNCSIAQDGKLGCTENNPWNRESFRTTIGKDTVIGGVNITKARHVSLMLTSIDNNANQTRRKVVLSENGSLWLSRTCPYKTNAEGYEDTASCYQPAWTPDSPTAQVNLPTILSTGYVAQPYNHKQSVHVYLVEESGEYFHDRICSLNTGNNEGYWNCANDGAPGQFAKKSVSTLNLPASAGGKLNSIYGLVSEATSLGLPDAPVAKTYIRSFLSEDKGTIYEQSCAVDESLTGDTVKYDTCSEFKSYPVSVLNGKTSKNVTVTFTSQNVDSVNFFNYKDKNGNEKIKITVLVDGSDLYTRSCGMKANKTMNCTNNNNWSVQKVSKLNIVEGETKVTTLGGYDATITPHKESEDNPVTKDYLREVVLATDLKSIYTRACPATTSGAADTSNPSKCTTWDKKVFQTDIDFNDNGTFNDEDIIVGADSYVQKNNGVLDIRVSFIRESQETFFTRICPLNTYALTGSHNCNTSPKRTFSEVDLDVAGSIELPVSKASGMNGLLSTATSLGFNPISTSPSPTPTLSVVSCSEKVAEFSDGGPYQNSEVTYTVSLAYPTPGAQGEIIIRDNYSVDNIDMDLESLTAAGCTFPDADVLGASTTNTSDGKVLGVSDYYTEKGSLLISVILLSVVAGGTAYVIVLNNKASIKSELLKKNPYLAGLLATAATLILGGVLIVIIREDVSPTGSSADSAPYFECVVEPGTTSITYKGDITGSVGEEVTNTVQVLTNGVASEDTCESTFEIEERDLTDSLTPTPSITPSATIIPEFSPTPSITPSATTIPEFSPTPSITPSATIIPEFSPTPTPMDVTPTPTVVGVACGPADIIIAGVQNDKFDIVDFGGTGGFASFYQKTCNDSANDFSNPETGVNCGGKDATKDNIVNIHDFVSFADRYTSESCEL